MVFDILARDGASRVFDNVGNAAGRAGQQTSLFGSAMKVAGAALLGGGLISGFQSLYQAAAESAKVTALTEQVIRSTGGAANLTAKQVGDLVTAISNKTGVDDEAIQSGSNLLLTFTNIKNAAGEGNDIFTQTTQIMTDMSVALGTDASGSAIQLGKALNDPIQGITALTRVGVSFTAQQKEQIKGFVEAGDVMSAQKIILEELGREFGGAAEAAATPLDKLKVNVGNLAEEVGAYLIPVVDKASTFFMRNLLPALESLGPAMGFVVDAVGGMFAAFGDVLGVLAEVPTPIYLGVAALVAFNVVVPAVILATKVIALNWAAMNLIIAASGGFVAAARAALVGLVGFLGGPVGIAIAAVAIGLGFLTSSSDDAADSTGNLADQQNDLTEALRVSKGAIDANVRAAAAKVLQDEGVLDTLEDMGIETSRATDAILGQGDAYGSLIAQLTMARDAGTSLTGTQTDGAVAARAAIVALRELAGQTEGTIATTQQLAAATAGTGTAMSTATAQTAEAIAVFDEWIAGYARISESFIEPLSVYKTLLQEKGEAERAAAEKTAAETADASDSWEDFVTGAQVNLQEYATALDGQIAAMEMWRTNLVTISQRGGMEVAQILADMGVEGAQITADMAVATEADFIHMRDSLIRETHLAGAGANAEFGQAMQVMALIGRDGSVRTVQAVARELGLGVAQVRAIAASYGVELASGINPILSALGRPSMRLSGTGGYNTGGGYAEGGYTGDGGKYEPKGVVHGGEWVTTKEKTAQYRPVLEAINAGTLPGYAAGGFVSTGSVPKPRSTAPYGPPISTAGDGTMQKGYDETVSWLAANLPPPWAGGGAGTANGVGRLGPAAARAHQFVRSNWGFGGTIGGFAYRNIAGTNQLSKHALGKAIDVMIGTNMGLGQSIADYFSGPGRGPFGVDNVIWNRRINSGRGWTGYSGSSPHTDHPHIDFYHGGGVVPDFGMPNVPAFLAPGETVRTAAQERALAPNVQVRVFIGEQELTHLVRVESENVVIGALTGATDRGRYNG